MTHDPPIPESNDKPDNEIPKGLRGGSAIRAVLTAAGGAIPFVGGILSAGAGAWSEHEQEKINTFFEHWLKMLQEEMAEKAQTILEIMARLDMNDQKTAERVASPEYQSLVRKAFRDWAGAESEEKRQAVRNILAQTKHELPALLALLLRFFPEMPEQLHYFYSQTRALR